MSSTQMHDGARRQPATITVAQTLLVLSTVGSAVGLILSVYLVGVVLDAVARFQSAFSPYGGLGAGQQAAAGPSSQVTVALVLAAVEAVAVVAVSIWAFRAIGQARAVARVVLATLAAAQVVLSVTGTLVAGAGIGLVVVVVVVGLLVFDAPVLILLFVPVESRRWFDGTAPTVAGPNVPVAHAPDPSASPAPSWGPPAPPGPPRSAPFPASRGTGPFPQPPRGPAPEAPRPPSGGRHAAPRPPQH